MGAHSEPRGRARAVFHDFEAHGGSKQREIREKCTALPTGAVGATQVRQAPRSWTGQDHPPARLRVNSRRWSSHNMTGCASIRIRLPPATNENAPAVAGAHVAFCGSGGLLPLKFTKLVFLIYRERCSGDWGPVRGFHPVGVASRPRTVSHPGGPIGPSQG